MKRVSGKEYKTLTAEKGLSGAGTEDLIVLRYTPGSIEVKEPEAEGARRLFRFRMTDASEDREGDIVFTSGGNFENFEKGGSLLWGHRSDDPWLVIGKPVGRVERRATEAYGVFELMDGKDNPVAGLISKQLAGGYVRGSSIGFRVIEAAYGDRQGNMPIDFIQWELLEHSVTPVPANPRAIVDSTKDLNSMELSLLRTRFEQAIEGDVSMPGVERSELEVAWRSITPAKAQVEVTNTAKSLESEDVLLSTQKKTILSAQEILDIYLNEIKALP